MARIVVIDGEPQIRALLVRVLGRAGHQVAEATDPLAVLRRFKEKPADLVICDLAMPPRGEMHLIAELRRAFPRTKVVAMSGGAAARASLESLGVTHVLHKPFRFAALLQIVGELLAAPRPNDAPASV